jgi:hypothetical protein
VAVTVQPGECFESGIWMDGRETEDQKAQCINDMLTAFYRLADANGVKIAKPTFTIKHPMDDRVPEVPKHISGPNVRLLVGEALIVGWAPANSPAGSFVTDQLDKVDLARLRKITRRAHRKHNPGAKRLSDAQVDAIIERVGPDSAAKAVRHSVDSQMVH